MAAELDIIYQDQHFVAICKPPGIHVHRSEFSPQESSCMQLLRDQIQRWIFPLHRLDRATSGVLLFALTQEAAQKTAPLFAERAVQKSYLALVRGFLPTSGEIDRPLKENRSKSAAEAITRYQCLQQIELPYAVGKFETTRYSLCRVMPHTGRRHQIRRHLAGAAHPIVGDVLHGDGRHNRFFREKFDFHRMMLFSQKIRLFHPFKRRDLSITANPDPELVTLFQKLAIDNWEFESKST